MAKMAKSKDTANWRKGNAILKGDLVAVAWNGETVTETSPIAKIETSLYMSRRGFVFTTESGYVIHAASNEFVEGRYNV